MAYVEGDDVAFTESVYMRGRSVVKCWVAIPFSSLGIGVPCPLCRWGH